MMHNGSCSYLENSFDPRKIFLLSLITLFSWRRQPGDPIQGTERMYRTVLNAFDVLTRDTSTYQPLLAGFNAKDCLALQKKAKVERGDVPYITSSIVAIVPRPVNE
jgi:hypothetical protein